MNSGMLKTVLLYGLALAAGAVTLEWLEYKIWARAHAGTVYVALIAAGFLGLGIWVGRRLFRSEPRRRVYPEPARKPRSASPIAKGVLQLLADGRSNKEIAARLGCRPIQ
jgi:hypothetical protein